LEYWRGLPPKLADRHKERKDREALLTRSKHKDDDALPPDRRFSSPGEKCVGAGEISRAPRHTQKMEMDWKGKPGRRKITRKDTTARETAGEYLSKKNRKSG